MALGVQSSFSYGVVSASLQGRTDTDMYQAALNRGHNVIIDLFGGVRKRPPLKAYPYRNVRITDKGPIVPFRYSAYDSALWQLNPTGVDDHVRFVGTAVDTALRSYTFQVEDIIAAAQGQPDAGRLSYSQQGDLLILTNRRIAPFNLRRTSNGIVLEDLDPSVLGALNEFGHPATVAYYQQRLIFAGSDARPGSLITSKVGDYDDFSVPTPITEASPVDITLASRRVDRILHVATLKRMLLFTEGGEWEVTGQITPSQIGLDNLSWWGSSDIPVLEAQNFMLFVPPDKNTVRAIELNEYDNIKSRDLTLFARDIFKDRVIFSMAHTGRYIIVTFTDGTAAVCTYDGESGVPAWTTMDTQLGALEEVFTLPVAGENRFFFVVSHARTEERYLVDFDIDNDRGPYCDHVDYLEQEDLDNGYIDLDLLTSYEGEFGIYNAADRLALVPSTLAPTTNKARVPLPSHLSLAVPSSEERTGGVAETRVTPPSASSGTTTTGGITVRGRVYIPRTDEEAKILNIIAQLGMTVEAYYVQYLEGLAPPPPVSTTVAPTSSSAVRQVDLEVGDFLIGLPYASYIETLNLDNTGQGRTAGRRQSVARVRVQVANTRGLLVGPSGDRMESIPMRQFEAHGEDVRPFTGFLRVPIPREWESNGKVRIESRDPYRMEILRVIPDTQLGDE